MRPGIKLFVGNVPEEATAEELSELFAGVAGPVLGIALMKQFAFVHLRDEAAAARAIAQLNGHQLHGRRIVVEPSRPRPTNTCKIFVGNVSAACTSGELRSLFQQYGTVVECDVVKDYAFVHMENEADAKVAIENLNGKEVKGRRVNVELSTNVQKKGGGGGGGAGGGGGLGLNQNPPPSLPLDKTKRLGLEYREKFTPKLEPFDQRRAGDAAAAFSSSSANLYDYHQRFGVAKYEPFDPQPRPPSSPPPPSYFPRDRSPLRRSPYAAAAAVALPVAAQPVSYRAQPSASLGPAYRAQPSSSLGPSYRPQPTTGPAYRAQPSSSLGGAYRAQPLNSSIVQPQNSFGGGAAYGAQNASYPGAQNASYGGAQTASYGGAPPPAASQLSAYGVQSAALASYGAQPAVASGYSASYGTQTVYGAPPSASYGAVATHVASYTAHAGYGAAAIDGHAGAYGAAAQPGAALSTSYGAVAAHAATYGAQPLAGGHHPAYQPVTAPSVPSYGAQPVANYGAQLATGQLAAGHAAAYGAQPAANLPGSYGGQSAAAVALSATYGAQASSLVTSYGSQVATAYKAQVSAYRAQPGAAAVPASYPPPPPQPSSSSSSSSSAALAAAYRAYEGGPNQLGQSAASYLGLAQAPVAPPYERTRLSPPRSAAPYEDPYKKPAALAKRYGAERRLSDLSDFRRVTDSPLAYRRSPTKSPLDYRRLPDPDYPPRYSGGYGGDYLPAPRLHSGYQRRL
ncbi:RNA-binding protein 14 isoform X1 [Heliangelus exortis]|uniref:RNA-binding protein 14 isoform X1 n=1 Tax=Heliangelus exortis TaxID=472823 RepID=UPI003A8F44DD